ncbi:putative egl nine-like 1 [Apostichopus japonicus]|uniref:Putative egl nine-like 1 n=1 Tax=Stichopus japonicus TaxID=307972 RepID=A0A2G8LR55_STIJA|nr:putative egl nine-like 1 [Apostichopus japonicus]
MVECSTVLSSMTENNSVYNLATNSAFLQGCAYEVCNAIHNLKLCSGCHHAWYCSEEHQRKHWRTHRRNCKLKTDDPSDHSEATTTNTNPHTGVDHQTFSSPALSSRPNFNPPMPTTITSTNVRPSNTHNHTLSTGCGLNQPRADFRPVVNATYSGLSSQSPAELTRLVNYNIDQANSNTRPMLHPASMQAAGFSPNQTVFTASRGPYYVADNVFENSSGSKSNSVSQPVMEESDVIRHRQLHSSISTPFVVPCKLKDSHDSKLHKSDPFVEQDTDQFSENIRRSSSYPLSPLNAIETNSDVNSSDSLEMTDQRPESIIQRKSCSFMLGDDSPTSSLAADSVPVVERRESPVVNVSGNLQPHLKNSLIDYITQWMQTYGICVLDKFLTEEQGLKVLEEMKSHYQRGDFMAGQLVRGREDGSSKEIRGDLIAWSDGSEPNCSNIGQLISTMDSIVMGCHDKLAGCKVSGRTKVC